MQFQYKSNLSTNQGHNAGDWFSDTFLGTQNRANKDALFRQNEQNRFSEYMSNTAHQRGMQDMIKAGINPMIAYGQGMQSGASSPSSAQSSPSTQGSGVLGAYVNRAMQFPFDLTETLVKGLVGGKK